MGLIDPTTSKDAPDLRPLAPRVDSLEGKRIGLYDNGKMAAEPVMDVFDQRLHERYADIETDMFSLQNKQAIADPDNVEAVKQWAREDIDVCVGAIGDCGSCTKFLTWGLIAIEEEGVPTVGLVDEAFVLDFQTNAVERGMALRFNADAVRSEIRDHDLIRERLTDAVMDAVEGELTRPRTEKETAATAAH